MKNDFNRMNRNLKFYLVLIGGVFIVGILAINYIAMDKNQTVYEKDGVKNDNSFSKKVNDIEYSVLRKESIGDEKLSLDIELKREYQKSDLIKFAHYLKENVVEKTYKRIFISYYLKGMKVGHGAWATSHFNPDLEVVMSSPYYDDTNVQPKIKVSRKVEGLLNSYSDRKDTELIGIWESNKQNVYVIFKRNGIYFLNEANMNNLDKGKDYELLDMIKNGRKTYTIKDLLNPENPFNATLIGEYTDYYVIEKNGDLVLYDKIGVIERYRKL